MSLFLHDSYLHSATLAERGHEVFFGSRDPEKAQAIAKLAGPFIFI
ncbi:hypothetical protein [Nostoc sp.]